MTGYHWHGREPISLYPDGSGGLPTVHLPGYPSIPSSCHTPLDTPIGDVCIHDNVKKPGSSGSTPEFNPDGTSFVRVRLPKKKQNEQFGCADLMMGANHIRVRCHDGIERMGRIKGKIKKRAWIREGDIVIIVPWSFQDSKCDILYRYLPPQTDWLRKNGYL